MRCIRCQNLDTKVIDSRLSEDGKMIRRRRECERCSERFTTFERVEVVNFVVKKSDGSLEFYDRVKVQNSITKAAYKRANISPAEIEGLINDLEANWAATRKVVTSKRIGKDILSRLRDLDEIAYIRFASIYHHFTSGKEFIEFLQEELQQDEPQKPWSIS